MDAAEFVKKYESAGERESEFWIDAGNALGETVFSRRSWDDHETALALARIITIIYNKGREDERNN